MKLIPALALATMLAAALSGCSQVQLDDVSEEAEYANLVGRSFVAVEPVWKIGVTADKNYRKQVDYFVLSPGAGFAGPEIVSRTRLDSGFTIKIKRVLAGSTVFSTRIVYVVDIDGSVEGGGEEARITVWQPLHENFGLHPDQYRHLSAE